MNKEKDKKAAEVRAEKHREHQRMREMHTHRLIRPRKPLKAVLSEKELDKLAEVIAEVETKTSGEIRLILARSSARTGHVFPLIAFALSTLIFLGVWHWRHLIMLEATDWLSAGILIGAALIALVLSQVNFIKRMLTLPQDREHQVWARAELEFHREGLSHTKDKTGILIFLSLLEKQAVVLADKGIAEKLDPNVWNEVIKMILDGAREGTLADHLELGIRRCGELLRKHFPVEEGDQNELSNRVLVKD